MSVSPRLENYLCQSRTEYEIIPHNFCERAYDIACMARLPASKVVKTVVLRESKTGKYLAAVVPAANKIKLSWVNNERGHNYQFATEVELQYLYPDCLSGAVPAFSQAYDMDVIWDDQLAIPKDLYFEAGNHEELIHITREQFKLLFGASSHSVISLPADQFSMYHADEVRGSLN